MPNIEFGIMIRTEDYKISPQNSIVFMRVLNGSVFIVCVCMAFPIQSCKNNF